MKTFDDLVFKNNKARLQFDNGYGISVITETMENEYTWAKVSKDYPYEIAILDKSGNISYTTKITNDVLGYCNINKVNSIMKRIQELKKYEE